MKTPLVCLAALAAAAATDPAHAQWMRPGDEMTLQYGPRVIHYRPSPEHVNETQLVNVQVQSRHDTRWGAERSLYGFAAFNNSFGQPSQYVYLGQQWHFGRYWYAKITAGLLYGYRGEYRDKIPLNQLGIAPALIPSLGLRLGPVSIEGIMLGSAGYLFGLGFRYEM